MGVDKCIERVKDKENRKAGAIIGRRGGVEGCEVAVDKGYRSSSNNTFSGKCGRQIGTLTNDRDVGEMRCLFVAMLVEVECKIQP